MKYKIGILTIMVLFSVFGCTKYWDEHYKTQPETVNENVWAAIQADPDLSVFVSKIKEFRYDTLFLSDNSYTLFIPDNEALNLFLASDTMSSSILNYLICEQFIQANVVSGNRKIQTLAEKFAVLEHNGNVTLFDGIKMDFESPLYLNGKFFKMSEVAIPKPNLYEYIAQNNPILQRFIDDQDSIVIDKEKSRPVGFDEFGNTVYDTVAEEINMFEQEYFPIKHEFRSLSATIAFPVGDVYNNALTVMAEKLGGNFVDYRDIPYDWQEKILIPKLLLQGVFLNMLEREEFLKQYEGDTVKLKNILGDSIGINYIPSEKIVCSNGYAYGYSNYAVPDSLYTGSSIFEAEWLLMSAGINKYNWFPDKVKVTSDVSFQPVKEYNNTASNDSIIKINFTKKYSGKYILEFNTKSMFPRKYIMIVRTNMDIGGIYNIYVNDELVKTINYYDYIKNKTIYYSVYKNERVLPEGRFHFFDCWVESIWEYGPAKIKIEYKGPGNLIPNNGLVIDYIEFIPESSFTGYKNYRK